LWVNAGSSHGVASPAIVSCIQGETGLPASVIGKVTVHEDHSEVEVAEQHARSIISRLNRAHFQGRRLRAKLA
jgi:ATP-dependent RNA helicase DeaD